MREGAQGICMNLYRAMKFCINHHLSWLSKAIYYMIQIMFNCVIPPQVEIGEGTKIAHGVGIVLHHKTVIGKNCTIMQNVTVGTDQVIIGDNVLLGAGCVVLEPCKIGDNVKIGANTFVNFDVPDNSTVVGVKGTIISHENKENA